MGAYMDEIRRKEAEKAYEERMARARLKPGHPDRKPYPLAARVAQRAYDRVMRGEPANGKVQQGQ